MCYAFACQIKASYHKNHPCVNSVCIIALWITQHPPERDGLGLEKQRGESLSLFLSLPPSLPLSAFPVFFCVPGPGLLTLASSCVVLLPEGTVLGSTNSSNSWGGKSGIKGCVVCMGVKRIIFVCLFFQKAFLFWSIISNFIQRHHPFHVWCQQKWWMEWSLFPFFSHLLTSNQTLLQQLCNYFFLQILKWKLFQKCWPITDCKKKFSYIIPVWTSCSD